MAALVIVEAVALAVLGGALGIGGAYGLLHFTGSRSGPKASRWPSPRPGSRRSGIVIAVVVGAVAGLAPAVRSARLPIVRACDPDAASPFDYAVRNLGRRPLRTALTIAASALVTALLVATAAVRGLETTFLGGGA